MKEGTTQNNEKIKDNSPQKSERLQMKLQEFGWPQEHTNLDAMGSFQSKWNNRMVS